jgi:hypothetical protein
LVHTAAATTAAGNQHAVVEAGAALAYIRGTAAAAAFIIASDVAGAAPVEPSVGPLARILAHIDVELFAR